MVTFNPDQDAERHAQRDHRLHGDLQLRDRAGQRSGWRHRRPSAHRSGRGATPVPQPVITPVAISPTPPSGEVVDPNAGVSPNLTIPTWGPGGTNSGFDVTTSTLALSNYSRQTVSGLTVNLNIVDPLIPPDLGNDGDLEIQLTHTWTDPVTGGSKSSTVVLYEKPGDTNQNFTNVTFSDQAAQSILLASGPYTNGTFQAYQPAQPLTGLNGSQVNGNYTLSIDNFSLHQLRNAGELVDHGRLHASGNSPVRNERPAPDRGGDGPERRWHVQSKPADHAIHGPDPRRRVCGPDAPAHGAFHVQRHQYPQPAI